MDFIEIKRFQQPAFYFILLVCLLGLYTIIRPGRISDIYPKINGLSGLSNISGNAIRQQYSSSQNVIRKVLGADAEYVRDVTGFCVRKLGEEDNILKWQQINFLRQYKNPCFYSPDKQLLCLPYMMLVGTAKCGTTDLFNRISLHPDFVRPTTKQNHWLAGLRIAARQSLTYYSTTNFSPLARRLEEESKKGTRGNFDLITGEGSVGTLDGNDFSYLVYANKDSSEPVENNPEYIHHLNKDTRILINVRNPIDRLWSEYLAFSAGSNKSAEQFHRVMKRELEVYRHCLEKRTLRSCLYDIPLSFFASMSEGELAENEGLCRYPCLRRNFEGREVKCRGRAMNSTVFLQRSVYHVFIEDYLRVFPRNQVLVQRLEDISKKPRKCLIKTFKFLGLRIPEQETMDKLTEQKVSNKRRKENQHFTGMFNSTREMLYAFFKPHNRALALLMNDTLYEYGMFS